MNQLAGTNARSCRALEGQTWSGTGGWILRFGFGGCFLLRRLEKVIFTPPAFGLMIRTVKTQSFGFIQLHLLHGRHPDIHVMILEILILTVPVPL